jgi:hypothetical protein
MKPKYALLLLALACFAPTEELEVSASAHRLADVGAADEIPELPSSRVSFRQLSVGDKSYLRKEIIKDRVPGGYATFVAHLYKAADPLHHFSVLQPRDGCGTLSTPGETADAHGGCDVATNGGFFVPGTDVVDHSCLGPVVSDGHWRHLEHRDNVLFGVLAPRAGDSNVTYFFGYMGERTVRKTRWLQLVSGVVWLVRDGRVNVQNSMRFENFTAERSGTGEHFRTLRAPRLSVGVNAVGELLILAVDGSEPDWEGLSLDDVASIMVSLGAIQAINLDGGGSVSVFEGDDIVNVPSDVCPNTTFPKYRCARKVSSVMCLHRFATPRITRTVTSPLASPTLYPSVTTYSMSMTRAVVTEKEDSWGNGGWLQRGLIVASEVIMGLALVLWVVWHGLSHWHKWEGRGLGDRVRLASVQVDDADASDDVSDMGGDAAVDPLSAGVELQVHPNKKTPHEGGVV